MCGVRISATRPLAILRLCDQESRSSATAREIRIIRVTDGVGARIGPRSRSSAAVLRSGGFGSRLVGSARPVRDARCLCEDGRQRGAAAAPRDRVALSRSSSPAAPSARASEAMASPWPITCLVAMCGMTAEQQPFRCRWRDVIFAICGNSANLAPRSRGAASVRGRPEIRQRSGLGRRDRQGMHERLLPEPVRSDTASPSRGPTADRAAHQGARPDAHESCPCIRAEAPRFRGACVRSMLRQRVSNS